MEQKNGMLVGIFSLVICVIIVMGVMTPIVSDWTTGERIENEGAGWLRMSYESSPSYQSIAADLSGEGVVVYNDSDGTPEGTQTLSGTEDTIIYADNNLALWYENDTLFLLGQIDGNPVFVQRNDAISLIRESDGIRVSATDTPTITFPFPTYAYEPNSDGNYAFFTNGTPVEMESGRPNAIVGGGFAGVYAYNNIFRYAGLGLGIETEYNEDGKLVNVSWDKITEEENTETPEPLGAPYIRITHEDDIDEIDSVSSSENGGLRAVPTPTYTDGDWGYELTTVSGVQKATIVSYSGAGGNITIPSTVGGYDVYQLGKGSGNQVFDNSAIASGTTVTISPGPVIINNNSFGVSDSNPSKIVGVSIPNTVTTINSYAFYKCGITSLTIPDSVVSVGDSCFDSCKSLTEVHIGSGLTKLSKGMFTQCSALTSIDIPSTVTEIVNSTNPSSSGAFAHCTSITKITLHEGLQIIGGGAFYNCSALTEMPIIPSSVTMIGLSAFYNASYAYGTIVIPQNVTTIGNQAFYDCRSVSSVVISSDATPGNQTFQSTNAITEILDLSDTVDYSVNRYGMPSSATVRDSIGDCFGYISFTELGSDPAITGPIATLLIAVPLLMVVGLTIAAMSVMRGRVQ